MKLCTQCSTRCSDNHRFCSGCGADLSHVTPTSDSLAGMVLADKYKLVELIGAGGMGEVYRAEHLSLGTPFAVKLLSAELAALPESAARFQREATLASQLRHPNAVTIVDFGRAVSGELFLVMELVKGRTLAELIRTESPLAPQRVANLLGQALAALDEAHAGGLVHRDFKPDNILVERLRLGAERVKVVDFGLARMAGAQSTQLTRAGMVCGTPTYMAPEQIRGADVDARTDVYAAGAVLFEALVGKPPFDGDSPFAVLHKQLNEPPPAPSQLRPALTHLQRFDPICLRALAKDPAQRYASAEELSEAMFTAVRELSGVRCSACGALVIGSPRFCEYCGLALRPSGEFHPVPTQPPVHRAESRVGPWLPKLVGRDSLLSRLQGASRPLLLVGTPGVGKTSVVRAHAQAQAGRRRVVVAAADPAGAARPLFPLQRLVCGLLELPERPSGEDLRRATREHTGELTGVGQLFGIASELPAEVRWRECRAAVLSIVRRQPALCVFDDVDRYDAPSLEVCRHMAANPGTATLLFTAGRERVLGDGVDTATLPPLDGTALEELGVPAAIVGRSGGVPLAVELEVQAAALGASQVVLANLVGTLPAPPRALLSVCAVAGPLLTREELATLAEVGQPAEAFAQLEQSGWARPEGRGFEVRSPTLRQSILGLLPDGRERELHARIATLLAAREPAVAAFHACLANAHEAVEVIERAGDLAAGGFDHEAAARFHRAALEFARERQERGDGEARATLRIALKVASTLREKGEARECRQVLGEARALATRQRDLRAEVDALLGLARLAGRERAWPEAREHTLGAIERALRVGDVALLAQLYLELAGTFEETGDPDAAARELDEALLLCSAGDREPPAELAQLRYRLARLALRARRHEEACRHAAAAIGPAAPASLRAQAHALWAESAHALGRRDDAARHRRDAAEAMLASGDRQGSVELLRTLSATAGVDAGEAATWRARADELSRELRL